MYTVSTAQNPSSASVTPERAAAVYAVAQKHDLVSVLHFHDLRRDTDKRSCFHCRSSSKTIHTTGLFSTDTTDPRTLMKMSSKTTPTELLSRMFALLILLLEVYLQAISLSIPMDVFYAWTLSPSALPVSDE